MAKRGRGVRSVDRLMAAVWRISTAGPLNIVSEGSVVALMRQGQAHEAMWAVTRACHLGDVRLLSHMLEWPKEAADGKISWKAGIRAKFLKISYC